MEYIFHVSHKKKNIEAIFLNIMQSIDHMTVKIKNKKSFA